MRPPATKPMFRIVSLADSLPLRESQQKIRARMEVAAVRTTAAITTDRVEKNLLISLSFSCRWTVREFSCTSP